MNRLVSDRADEQTVLPKYSEFCREALVLHGPYTIRDHSSRIALFLSLRN